MIWPDWPLKWDTINVTMNIGKSGVNLNLIFSHSVMTMSVGKSGGSRVLVCPIQGGALGRFQRSIFEKYEGVGGGRGSFIYGQADDVKLIAAGGGGTSYQGNAGEPGNIGPNAGAGGYRVAIQQRKLSTRQLWWAKSESLQVGQI